MKVLLICVLFEELYESISTFECMTSVSHEKHRGKISVKRRNKKSDLFDLLYRLSKHNLSLAFFYMSVYNCHICLKMYKEIVFFFFSLQKLNIWSSSANQSCTEENKFSLLHVALKSTDIKLWWIQSFDFRFRINFFFVRSCMRCACKPYIYTWKWHQSEFHIENKERIWWEGKAQK